MYPYVVWDSRAFQLGTETLSCEPKLESLLVSKTNQSNILSVSSRALLDASVRRGGNVEELLEIADLQRWEVYDPKRWLLDEKVVSLWMATLERSTDPFLVLHAAAELPLGSYDVIDNLALCSSTIGQGVESIARFFGLMKKTVLLKVEKGEQLITVRFKTLTDPTGGPRPMAEYALAAIVARSRSAWGRRFYPHSVSFAGPPIGTGFEYRQLFGCPVEFHSDRTQLVFEREVWETPVGGGNKIRYAMLERRAKNLLKNRRPDDWFTDRVRDVVGDMFLERRLDLPSVAKRLSMSPRTLQRRLGEAGYSFGILLCEMRLELAQRYLHWDIPLSHVALQLGYSEQSAFTRAFKKWTGSTPAEYRRRVM